MAELDHQETGVRLLQYIGQHETVTFVFAAEDEEHNSAVALKQYLEQLK